jgi:ribosomal protein L3 glutamine methyltransferase
MSTEQTQTLTGNLATIRDWWRYGVSLYYRYELSGGQGFRNGADEILFLLRKTLHLPLDDIEFFLDAKLTLEEQTAIELALERRVVGREPVAYITNCMEYGGLDLFVNRSVLIPRSYFVDAIPEQLEGHIEDPEEPMQVLDLCCGSGCVGILAAIHYPQAFVDLADISGEALEVAEKNIERHGLEHRMRTLQSDLFEGLEGELYDVILCNPPYEPDSVLDRLPPEFGFEPPAALVSGADGMDLIRRILESARKFLADDGILVIEVGGLRALIEETYPSMELEWLETADADGDIAVVRASELP